MRQVSPHAEPLGNITTFQYSLVVPGPQCPAVSARPLAGAVYEDGGDEGGDE
jgi:hypothetical protein